MTNSANKLKDKDNNIYYPCSYFPIGAIYISITSINPATYFGGTWEQIKDVFLLACGTKYKNGTTGGEENHTLTINEIPYHSHNISSQGNDTLTKKRMGCKRNRWI